MNESTVSILDLPDETLIHILKKLNSFDVLFSLLGVNEQLDRLVCDTSFTRHLDLMPIKPDRTADSTTHPVLDRFCMQILSRISHQVESVTLPACLLPCVLHACNYLHLHKLVIIDLELSMACQIFNENSPFVHVFEQISDLAVTINDKISSESSVKALTDVYDRAFVLFPNVKCLEFDTDDHCVASRSLLFGLSPRTCFSSSIVHLRIKMHNIDDCLYLLDGRLSQLRTLILNLDYIHDPVLLRRCPRKVIRHSAHIMNNVSNPLRLKCFSLHVYLTTSECDGMVMPLLRRMTFLETLILSLRVGQKDCFVDGNYLENYLLSQMPHLKTFHFDILNEHLRIDQQHPQLTADDIRRTFSERGYQVDCYIDNGLFGPSRCHVYSLPFHMDRMHQITIGFPGGMFINVRVLHMRDSSRPFEHHFFAQISRSFPLLSRLMVANPREQQEKEKCSIIEFSHLVELDYGGLHIDYVEQFLSDLNTRLPCLKKLIIPYKELEVVTENFTRNATRRNCAKLEQIDCGRRMTRKCSKDYHLYFPSLL